jgi:hypothetical protein
MYHDKRKSRSSPHSKPKRLGQARLRVERTLRFALEKMPNEHGWFYHFVDWKNGKREWKSEISSIDTGLLLAGALVPRDYFGGSIKGSGGASTGAWISVDAHRQRRSSGRALLAHG